MKYLTYRPAGNLKRVCAFLIDVVPIQMGLYLVCHMCFAISPIVDHLARPEVIMDSLRAKLLIDWGTLLIWIVYCILGELSPWRGTYGKKAMGIHVRPVHGKRLTLGMVLGRNAAKILSVLPCYLGFFAAFVVYGNRAWHDSLSRTAVSEDK